MKDQDSPTHHGRRSSTKPCVQMNGDADQHELLGRSFASSSEKQPSRRSSRTKKSTFVLLNDNFIVDAVSIHHEPKQEVKEETCESNERASKESGVESRRATRRTRHSSPLESPEPSQREEKHATNMTTDDHSSSEDEDYVPRRRTRRTRLELFQNSTAGKSKASETDNSAIKVYPTRRTRRTVIEEAPGRRSRSSSGSQSLPDMYSIVKRKRLRVKRDMYGFPINEDEEHEDIQQRSRRTKRSEVEPEEEVQENEVEEGEDDEAEADSEEEGDSEDSDEESEESSEEEEEQAPVTSKYNLRETRRQVKPLEITHEYRPRRRSLFLDSVKSSGKQSKSAPLFSSPARRMPVRRRKRVFHGNSSTSSSGSDSDDERRFKRRKEKSMNKARSRMLPINLRAEDVQTGLLADRVRAGASLADVDPMNIDSNVNFDSVGGLGRHINKLREMIIFPLLYPEIFDKYKMAPPRGVLFYGPPGTGKTLVARALANECSSGGKRVSFFMRKGADCLSKWVGESERQLRLLFDQAFQMRPSIIFFDEIDGLAPVRSSRQDQIHSSIVSTLLALMDGLDSRGEVVVIGATNRLDSIDPALRRPGRFDREFEFPLPSVQARQQILKIHTKEWTPKLCEPFLQQLAESTVGYCGADLRALCTEAALHAVRRRYPQIYACAHKLQLDVSSIKLSADDFAKALKQLVPASSRGGRPAGRALEHTVTPLLQPILEELKLQLSHSFPCKPPSLDDEDLAEDANHDLSIFVRRGGCSKDLHYPSLTEGSSGGVYCPRLLLCGEAGMGQTRHLAPALLHSLEGIPVHCLDMPALYAISARAPEEACAQAVREACRSTPSVLYIPDVGSWWLVAPDTVRATLLSLLATLPPSLPLLLLSTAGTSYQQLPREISDLFDRSSGEVVDIRLPNEIERRAYFHELLIVSAARPPPSRRQTAQHALEELAPAPAPAPPALSERELKSLRQQEESTLRELRLFLRDVINRICRDRKYAIFMHPVDQEEVPDYYDIIKSPMDLETMMRKIDLKKYETVTQFHDDINLICSNALEYNPDTDQQSRAIRHRAAALRDDTYAIIDRDLDPEFEKTCEQMAESRHKRGDIYDPAAPRFYYTKPVNPAPASPQKTRRTSESFVYKEPPPVPTDPNVRFSRRLRHIEAPALPPADEQVCPKQRMSPKKTRESSEREEAETNDKENSSEQRDHILTNGTEHVDEEKMEVNDEPTEVLQNEEKEVTEGTDDIENRQQDEDKEQVTDETKQSNNDEPGETAAGQTERQVTEEKSDENKEANEGEPDTNEGDHETTEVDGEANEGDQEADEGDNEAEVTSPPRKKKKPEVWSYKRRRKPRRSQAAKDEHPPETSVVSCDVRAAVIGDMEENSRDSTDHHDNKSIRRSSRLVHARELAQRIMQETTDQPRVVVDMSALERLLERVVDVTSGCSVDRLERLHARLTSTVLRHRDSTDRAPMISELESIVGGVWPVSSSQHRTPQATAQVSGATQEAGLAGDIPRRLVSNSSATYPPNTSGSLLTAQETCNEQ